MGTRSLTHFRDGPNEAPFVTIYRQFDGHPDVHGAELAEAAARQLVNGFQLGQSSDNTANGMGCLAAQVIGRLKFNSEHPPHKALGNVYVFQAGAEDCGEEFVYDVFPGAEPSIGGDGKPIYPVIRCSTAVGYTIHEAPAPQFKTWAENWQE